MGNEKDTDIVDISEEIAESKSKKSEPEQKVDEEETTSVKQFRKKKIWVRVLIIVLIILAILAFIGYKINEAKKKLEEATSTDQQATITRMDITSSISTTGTIQSKDVRTITSPLSGVKIEEVNFKVGDMVQQGDIVVTFSREDINKKIGQLEEDITEAKQVKGLDAGDRNDTYTNTVGKDFYSVASSYQSVTRAYEDLEKARRDLQDICNQKGDFKSKYQEAKDNIEDVQAKLIKKQEEYDKWKLDPHEGKTEDQIIKEEAEFVTAIGDYNATITSYRSTINSYDDTIKTYEQKETTAQDTVDTKQRAYNDTIVGANKANYDAYFSEQKNDYTLNKGNVQANDNVKNLERQKEQNEDSLDNYIVTAPISGLVTAVNAQEGNGYQATTGALMTIQAVDIFEVTTQVDEYDINNVTIGQKVAIMTDATGEDQLEGKVTFIAPTATAATGNSSSNTFEVKIDILNKDERLRLGMSAKLNIIKDEHSGVLAVPYDAIEEKEGGAHSIYVLDTTQPAKTENTNVLGIEVVGLDGLAKSTGDDQSGDTSTGKRTGVLPKGKEIPVQIGLEGDYYTEIISPDIKEGMTVLVNSTAGELGNDMEMLMGGRGD